MMSKNTKKIIELLKSCRIIKNNIEKPLYKMLSFLRNNVYNKHINKERVQIMNATEEKELSSTIIREEIVGSGHIIYRMIKTNIVIENSPVCVYGIEIVSTLFSEKDSCTVKDISTKFDIANELFELTVKNMVLPCTLKDITYDFLVSKY